VPGWGGKLEEVNGRLAAACFSFWCEFRHDAVRWAGYTAGPGACAEGAFFAQVREFKELEGSTGRQSAEAAVFATAA